MQTKKKVYQLLRRSEKYTKTDMVYLARGGSWLTFGQVVSVLCAFLLSVAFANFLPKEIYGQYRYIISITGALIILTLPGLKIALVRAVARSLEGSLLKALTTKLKWSVMFSLTLLGMAGYFYYQTNYNFALAFLVAAILFPLSEGFVLYSSYLVGKKLFDLEVKYRLTAKIISTGLMALALLLSNNLIILVLTYFLSQFCFNGLFFYLTLRKLTSNKKEGKKTISYGKHLTVMDALNNIAAYLDKILVFHFIGPIELAVYSFATAPPEQIKGLLKNIEPLALPKLATKTKREVKKTILSKSLKFGLFVAVGVIAYILLSPLLYKIFFPKYIESVFYSQIFSISLIGMIGTPIHIALQSQMAKKQLYQFNIYTSLIQITLMSFLLYFYGLLGLILARVITRFINIGILSFLVKKI
jgi:O-antigen/teichoic acid export membrane protein